MQTVAQSFLVLELTDSGVVLGLTTAARFGPLLLLPVGGRVADRLDKRQILYATQIAGASLALVFGITVGTHLIQIWMVYVLASLLGLVNVFDTPARQALISELVPADHLFNAVTLNAVTINLARVVGGILAGAVVGTFGFALCFELNAASFLAVLITLAMMSRVEAPAVPGYRRETDEGQGGLRQVLSTSELVTPLTMVALVGTLAWEFQVSLPLLAQNTFGRGVSQYGALASSMGVGAVVGGLVTASRRKVHMRSIAVAAIGWGVSIAAAAAAPTLTIEYGIFAFVGYGSVTFNAVAKTVLQLASTQSNRGMVMATWTLAWQGSTVIGGPFIGMICEQFGARWGLLTGGVSTLAVGLVGYPLLSKLDNAAAQAPRRPHDSA